MDRSYPTCSTLAFVSRAHQYLSASVYIRVSVRDLAFTLQQPLGPRKDVAQEWVKIGIGCLQGRRRGHPTPIFVRCESRACGNKQFVTWRVGATSLPGRHTFASIIIPSCSGARTAFLSPTSPRADATINNDASRCFPRYLRPRRSLTSRLSLRPARRSTTIWRHSLSCTLFHR